MRELPDITPGEGVYFDGKNKFIPAFLAKEIMNDFDFLTLIDTRHMYVYERGYYQPNGEVTVKRICRNRLEEEYSRSRNAEVLDFIEASTYTQHQEEGVNLLVFENGVLDLETMLMQDHTPDLYFFQKIPISYDPEAACPNIDAFHEQITSGPEDVAVLEEILGFALYRNYFIAKALMLAGGGSNGKSTWFSLAKAFIGSLNVSGRSLQELEEHRFAKADLSMKLANIYADLPDRALKRTGTFKMLTGRDLIAGEHKFQRSFTFENHAKLMFSANKVPETDDDTDAFFRRWIIVTFPNTFEGEDADPHIIDKLTTKEELSGLLNKALAGLKRLLENGGFSYSKTTDEIREEYIRKSSPIAAFVMDYLRADSDAFIEKKHLFNVFAAYCRDNKIPVKTQDTFYKNLPREAAITDYRPKVEDGRRPPSFKGLRYSLSASRLSAVSRVFRTLTHLSSDLLSIPTQNEWELLDVGGGRIKVSETLDTRDRVDADRSLDAHLGES